MDSFIERLVRRLARPVPEIEGAPSRRDYLGLVGRMTVASAAGLVVAGATARPAAAAVWCDDVFYDPWADPFLEFAWYDSGLPYDWWDLGDFGWPIVDPFDLQSPSQARVNACVARCVGTENYGALGNTLVRLDCEERCTRAEIERLQRQQQQRRLRRRRQPRRPVRQSGMSACMHGL